MNWNVTDLIILAYFAFVIVMFALVITSCVVH